MLIKPLAIRFLALLTFAASSPLNAEEPLWRLGGSYNFATFQKSPDGKAACEERWTFDADGNGVIVSGSEILHFRYRVEKTGHHTWLIEDRLKTNGLPDCLGHVQAAPGPEERRTFIFPLLIGDFLVCSGPQHLADGSEVISQSNCYARASHDRPPPAY